MRASSAEEQEEAPTAKKAKHEEQIRVHARDGEEVTLSQDAARLMGTLKDLMDLATSEDGIYPMPTIMASTLQMVCKLNDPDYTWPSSDEPSLYQLIQLLEDALYLDAPIALKHLQRAIASRLNGKRAPELGALIGAGGDFGSAEEHASHAAPVDGQRSDELRKRYSRIRVQELRWKLRKLGLTTDGTKPVLIGRLIEMADAAASIAEPAFQPSFSADAMEAALGLVDVATLAELKGVTRSWRTLAQRVLCSRLCRRDGQPVPTRLDEITDLDVEQLIEAGRPGDAAVAGRMLPGLSRLHGFGYVVDVAAVRAANLQCGMGGGMGGMGMNPATIAALIGYVGAGGMGMNPAMIAAQMGVIGAGGMPLANPMMGGAMGDWRRHPSLLHGAAKDALNICISGEGEPPLRLTIAAVACAGSGVICGIPVQQLREDSVTVLNLSNRGLHLPAAMLVASLIPATSVLKSCNLLKNRFDVESAKKLTKMGAEKGIMLSGMTRDQTVADFTKEGLQPADAILIASDLQFMVVVTTLYLAANSIGEGAKAIAEALKVNAVLTELSLGANNIGVDGAKAIAEALKVNAVLTKLWLWDNKIGDVGAKAIAEALKVNAVVTTLVLYNNNIGPEGAKAIAEALKVNAVLTRLDLDANYIGVDGAKAIAEALKLRRSPASAEAEGMRHGGIRASVAADRGSR
ncbi:nod3 protein [Chrysochromulina tobinii]|uniref:Nod3 protein n=1 Tax=Chrysochromulina tobinii TaxID=1460289 RepID=A0A0M0J8M9_9EUKA|nr:nod3 protein [Chrysochromulina tobinii]|eukprot:KOO22573.1 nod3 protein [Chrysochromulina sp. CCMP291]